MKTKLGKRLLAVCTVLIVLISVVAVSASATENQEQSVPYYGRSALAKMSNATALLYAYDAIAAGVETSQANIDIYNDTDPITADELTMVYGAYRRDYAHHFWLGNSYSVGSIGQKIVSLLPSYIMSGDTLTAARQAFDAAAAQLLQQCIDEDMSEFEKELAIHDALAARITYVSGAPNAHNAYGALVEGQAVCEGYAESLQYLLQLAGIQSFIATGSSIDVSTGNPVGHAWNYVRIDGQYYQVDLTWNDQGATTYHAYFNQTDAVMAQDHALDATGYALPVCTATAANYHKVNGTWFDTLSAETIGALLKENNLQVQLYYSGGMTAFWDWVEANGDAIAKAAGYYRGSGYGSSLGNEAKLCLSAVERAQISKVSVNVGQDLSMQYYVGVYDGEVFNEGWPAMRFTVNGKTFIVEEYEVTSEYYMVFTLPGLAPQNMGDAVDAVFYVDNGYSRKDITKKTGYTIEQNCKDLLAQYSTDATLTRFVNDLLVYGAAAQTYTGYKATDLVGADMNLTVGTAAPSVSDKMTISGNQNEDCYIKSVGVWFDTTNRLYLKIYAADDTFQVNVGGKYYDGADCEYLGDNIYKLTCDALAATELDTVYAIMLGYDNATCANLNYSANAYAYAILNGGSSNDKMIALAQALYNYGVAADAYVAEH